MAGTWIAVRQSLPWLTTPPYLVDVSELPRLRSDLRAAGFHVFDAFAAESTTERSLLLALGDALAFPDYYGANWAAFEDCVSDLVRESAGPTAVVIVGSDALMRADLHAFVRSVHLLLDVVSEVERIGGDFQFEVFFGGSFHASELP